MRETRHKMVGNHGLGVPSVQGRRSAVDIGLSVGDIDLFVGDIDLSVGDIGLGAGNYQG